MHGPKPKWPGRGVAQWPSGVGPGIACSWSTSSGTVFSAEAMGAGEHDLGRRAGLPGLAPALGAEAPAVAGAEAGEAELGPRGGEVVAAPAGEGEELLGDADADGVAAAVLGARCCSSRRGRSR